MTNILVSQTWPRERRALVEKLSAHDGINPVGFETGKDKLEELFAAIRLQQAPFVVISSQRGYRTNDTLGNNVHAVVCKTGVPSLTMVYARAVLQPDHQANLAAIKPVGVHQVVFVGKQMVADNGVSADTDFEHEEILKHIVVFTRQFG
jgi:hypothetical protein